MNILEMSLENKDKDKMTVKDLQKIVRSSGTVAPGIVKKMKKNELIEIIDKNNLL